MYRHAAKLGTRYLVTEFCRPILGGMGRWFYTNPENDDRCLPAKTLYEQYAGVVRHGCIFSLDVGPDRSGRLRKIDVETLKKVGQMVRDPPPTSLALGRPARASSVFPRPGYGPEKAFDGYENTRWGAGTDARSGWLEVDLGKPRTFRRAALFEGRWNRVQEFQLQYRDGETWRTFAKGTKMGDLKLEFEPVTARHVRLNILKATRIPTIPEFHLYAGDRRP